MYQPTSFVSEGSLGIDIFADAVIAGATVDRGDTISIPATRAPKTRFETFLISYFSSLSKRLKSINRYLNDTAH